MITIPPYHGDILYFGRVDISDEDAPRYSFPGVTIRATFTGTALDLLIKSHTTEHNAVTANFYTVTVDNNPPFILEVTPHTEKYCIARDLAEGIHTVALFKNSESSRGEYTNCGVQSFKGFRIKRGESIVPTQEKNRKLEFIGDSITCGYGNMISTNDPTRYNYTAQSSNGYMAWGAIAARMCNAEYLAVAYSGRGMVRNFANRPGKTLPEMYNDTLPDCNCAQQWDHTRWSPDIVTINLGTNDFSEGIVPGKTLTTLREKFRKRTIEFVHHIASHHPKASIILVAGPMMNNNEPAHCNCFKLIKEELLAVKNQCDQIALYTLFIEPHTAPFGINYHPTVATHSLMAEKVHKLIEQIYQEQPKTCNREQLHSIDF